MDWESGWFWSGPVDGHSQIGITLDLYSHVTVTMQAVAAEAMGRLLGGQDDGG